MSNYNIFKNDCAFDLNVPVGGVGEADFVLDLSSFERNKVEVWCLFQLYRIGIVFIWGWRGLIFGYRYLQDRPSAYRTLKAVVPYIRKVPHPGWGVHVLIMVAGGAVVPPPGALDFYCHTRYQKSRAHNNDLLLSTICFECATEPVWYIKVKLLNNVNCYVNIYE